MTRRHRRARRRLRRGDARREPLLLLADDRLHPLAGVGLLVRAGYRYRSELAPMLMIGALYLAALVLHAHHVAPLGVVIVALVVAAGLCWPRVAPLLRRVERGYAVGVVLAAGAWLTAASAVGPTTAPLLFLLVGATVVSAVPWWAHRRRRAKVRVERTLAAWPDIADAVGLPGSRVMSAVVDRWGWRARIGLSAGQTTDDVVNSASALESGLHTRPGAVRVEPDPDRADHALIRVLIADPHAQPIPYPTDTGRATTDGRSITDPIPLGLFEDARPVTVRLAHRHGLLGGVAGAGKSGVLNVLLAELVGCRDVVLWGVDLKGGMELQPWAPCLARLATTPDDATQLLGDAVTVLETRARRLAADGARLWAPSTSAPALIVVVDEYAELADESAVATGHADSIARRGRAVAVTLLAATQRPTQKAMGSGAVRSQMDVRICLRVRERRDVDLILGQGMLTAGWAAHNLNAPGKFLISTPEHTTPRRARAYRVTDHDVAAIAARHAASRPHLDAASIPPVDLPDSPTDLDDLTGDSEDPEFVLWTALQNAPADGASVKDLMTATGRGRTWVYARLQELATEGRIRQVGRGRWTVTEPDTPR